MTFKEYIKSYPRLHSKDLNELEILGCGLTDLYGIEKYTKLLNLDISNNNIEDITPLNNLKDIRVLNIGENFISDISTLDIKNLLQLYIYNNKITDISCLKNSDLIELNISNNLISNIDVICSMDNLSYLNISNNNLDIVFNKFYNDNDVVNLVSDKNLIEIKNIIKTERRKRLINLLDI